MESVLRWLFERSNPAGHLAEYVIHHQDIRRPLRMPRTVPAVRQGCAAARNLLIEFACKQWSVGPSAVQVRDGVATRSGVIAAVLSTTRIHSAAAARASFRRCIGVVPA